MGVGGCAGVKICLVVTDFVVMYVVMVLVMDLRLTAGLETDCGISRK